MPINRQQGSTLIESLIALTILLFAILGLIGLQANVVRLGSGSQNRMQASLLSQTLAGIISVDSANVGCYALVSASAIACPSNAARALAAAWRTDVLNALPNASEPDVAIAADRTVTIRLVWKSTKDLATRNYVLVVQPL
jgi:type IV pilus assembly protein PilV